MGVKPQRMQLGFSDNPRATYKSKHEVMENIVTNWNGNLSLKTTSIFYGCVICRGRHLKNSHNIQPEASH